MPFVASSLAGVEPPRVCVVGQHELDYPRNVVNQQLMRAAGYQISLCHSRARVPFRTWSIVAQYLRAAKTARVVFATEGSHRHIPWLRLATLWTRQAIVFDPFISLYNTEVEDRRLYRPGSLGAAVARLRDGLACRCADYLVFDTEDHKAYFFERYRLAKPYRILRVGVDEAVFRPRPVQPRAAGEPCQVLFYGTYIPLQGIDVIVAAAERLRADRSIAFTLIGDGQERARIRALAEPLALPNLRFVERLPPEQLAERIAAADICLGVFDSGIKAAQVVPNKVVQCAAMQKPVITRHSPAIEREFRAGSSVCLVPAGDPAALAAAVASLARDAPRRAALALEARKVFEEHFSVAAQTALMRALLDEASRGR
jgi:glycosyltransferase involved in cell wall biosynthesis